MTTETTVKEWIPLLEIPQPSCDMPEFAVAVEDEAVIIPLTRNNRSAEWIPTYRIPPTVIVTIRELLQNGSFAVAGGIPSVK